MPRKRLTKGVRFEVLKRDQFTCRYCGRKAPDVKLQVDHLVPVSKGGTNDLWNLACSCQECNCGKSAKHLGDAVPSLDLNTESVAQDRKRLEKYRDELNAKAKALVEAARSAMEYWAILNGDMDEDGWFYYLPSMKKSVLVFLKSITPEEVKKQMDRACSEIDEDFPGDREKYFYWLCWRTIKNDWDKHNVREVV